MKYKYNNDNLFNVIVESFPEFKKFWDNQSDVFKNESACSYAGSFAMFTIKNKLLTPEDKLKIFDLAEELILDGDNDVGTAICTCFLEDIVNYISNRLDTLKYEDFIPYIKGKESREYLIEYDKLFKTKVAPYFRD